MRQNQSPTIGQRTVDDVLATLRTPHRARARRILEMWAAGVAAVEPESAVAEALADERFKETVTVVALGKAASAMTRGAARVLGPHFGGGIVVTDHAEPVPSGVELCLGDHPDPGQSSLDAGRRLLDVVRHTQNPVLFLISGGGSALAEVPAAGLSIEDLVATRHILEQHGVAIDEMNTVRSHLSEIKGGRLAAATATPATTVVISDVVGGRPDLVASGPTVATSTTPDDARRVLESYQVSASVPSAVLRVLSEASAPPSLPEGHVLVAADGARAARAAAAGDGRVITTSLAGRADSAGPSALTDTPEGTIGVLAGETTVDVTGSGTGGRNQEAALAACLTWAGHDVLFLAAGTDGIDGPTDAAGALIDGGTKARIEQAGIDPAGALENNDANPALDAAGALVRIGPTGTNVADLWIVDRG